MKLRAAERPAITGVIGVAGGGMAGQKNKYAMRKIRGSACAE